MRRYFIWKDANCNGIDPEWLEITGSEFYQIVKSHPEKRFIPCWDEDDPESDYFLYEATKSAFNEWKNDKDRFQYRNMVLQREYTFVSLDELISEDDEEGLTWAEIIPDTSEEDAAAEKAFQKWKNEKIARLKELLKEIDEEEYGLLWNLILNPIKMDRMTEKAYAEKLGMSQQAVHKRKMKIFSKIRRNLGC